MLKTLHQIYKINVSSRINSFLYFVKKLPILKNKLKNTNYSFLWFKKAIGFISIIYKMISTPIKSLIIFFLAIFLPSTFLDQESMNLTMATLIFFFHYIFRIIRSDLLSYDFNKFIMVKQMRMDSRDYALATTFSDEILILMGKAIIFSAFINFNPFPLYGVVLAISVSFFAIFCEAINLFMFDKYGFNLNKYNALLVLVFIGIIGAAYALALISPFNIFLNILTSPLFLLSTILLGMGGSIFIYRYDDFMRVINQSSSVESLQLAKQNTEDIHLSGVKIREKDYKGEDFSINKFSNKEGYTYLNAIFFDRNKRIVYNPMIIKSSLILGVFTVFFIVVEFFHREIGLEIGKVMLKNFTLFFFVMYILCNSEKIIKSMFYNCDITLLRYGFYKKGDALLKMFFLRVLRIFYYNLVPTTILAIGVGFTVTHYAFVKFADVIPIILLLYALAMFFSIHYIFMYYIFQPFTSSMQVKNPFYSIINWLVYFVSYMLIQAPAPPSKFLPIILVLLISYVLVAILLVYKKAPQTFRVK